MRDDGWGVYYPLAADRAGFSAELTAMGPANVAPANSTFVLRVGPQQVRWSAAAVRRGSSSP